eukprot:m.22672 g.22672  ORF g.22672 m.22672 type:complete len:261 (+) comp28379_c0_seq2:13-795(+)
MSKLFLGASHAAGYAKFRPKYNHQIVEKIISYCKKQGAGLNLAVDVGCGSGQSTRLFKDHYLKIVGYDVSNEQLKQARMLTNSPNIVYKQGDATRIPMAENTVDLVSCAQAYHWLDHEKFHKECQRVLTQFGCIAVYGYGNCQLENPAAQEILSHFYWKTMAGCWDSRRHHIDVLYREFSLPFGNFVRDESLSLPIDCSLDDFIGYVSTWSAYMKYQERHPGDDHGVLEKLKTDLAEVYGSTHGHVTGNFPIFLLTAAKV